MADKITIQPVGYRVLVEVVEEEQTAGGLLVPPSAQGDEKPAFGIVKKLGISEDMEFPVNVGDKVFFKKFSPEEIEYQGVKYLVVEVDDIIAVIK